MKEVAKVKVILAMAVEKERVEVRMDMEELTVEATVGVAKVMEEVMKVKMGEGGCLLLKKGKICWNQLVKKLMKKR